MLATLAWSREGVWGYVRSFVALQGVGASRIPVSTAPRRAERYTLGYSPPEQERLARRTAAKASFLLPHLQPGMRLLDCGCGPGSITVGLAQVVAPGIAVGVDLEARQIVAARRLAADAGRANARFLVADAYALPFPDHAFDAAFAHTLLFHLSDPLPALREMRRVLRPGGVVGVRDPDYGAELWAPTTPLLEEARALLLRVAAHDGARPDGARHYRRVLLDAGFVRPVAYAFALSQGEPETVARGAQEVAARLLSPHFVTTVVGQGLGTQEALEAMAAEVHQWGRRSDAFHARLDCAALGWVEDSAPGR